MKKQLLILHGALGAKSQFKELIKSLSETYDVYSLDFDGHGQNDSYAGNYSIAHFAEQTSATLRALGWEKPLVFGYSMGGYVALKLEALHPGTFEKIITLGTKFDWNPDSAHQEARMLDPEKMQEKIPAYVVYLKSLHGDNHWKSVVERTAEMMLEMGNHPPITTEILQSIEIPVTCLRGANDQMVNEAETLWAVNALQHAVYTEIPEWKHPIDRIPVGELAERLIVH